MRQFLWYTLLVVIAIPLRPHECSREDQVENFGPLLTLSAALAVALAFGLISQRIGLSSIVGYLLAGVVIGPHTPGFVADQQTALQFAEIGVVLLMFGVGLRFHLRDLWNVRRIALPGALIQCAVTTAVGAVSAVWLGWGWGAALVLGVAVSVSSTVVMMRVLIDSNQLDSPYGHVVVGWTIVEDIVAVVALVVMPSIAASVTGPGTATLAVIGSAALAFGKVGLFAAIMLLVGTRLIPFLLTFVARLRSHELFTLATLVVALGIATASSVVFGTSLALGAFLAGLAVGQSKLSFQAAADAIPMRDAFAVLFFVSMGMLFDPQSVATSPWLVLAVVGVILIWKPVVALFTVLILGYSVRTGLMAAVCLAQIGEFSFILADLAARLGLLPIEGHSVLVAGALISIAINPLLLRSVAPLENWLRQQPRLWGLLNRRSETRARAAEVSAPAAPTDAQQVRAIVVGYGPVGRTVTRILRDFGIRPTVIELNVDTVVELAAADETVIYGDAGRREILLAAGVERASYLLVTLPDLASRMPVIATARLLNPQLQILTRARYVLERGMLEEVGTTVACYEEAEAAVALATEVLRKVGVKHESIEMEALRIRGELAKNGPGMPKGNSSPLP